MSGNGCKKIPCEKFAKKLYELRSREEEEDALSCLLDQLLHCSNTNNQVVDAL